MAVTLKNVRRLEGGSTLRAGYGTYIATWVASAAEDATFDLSEFGFKEAPVPISAVSTSAGGAVIVGIKGTPTAIEIVATVSGAVTSATITFSGRVS